MTTNIVQKNIPKGWQRVKLGAVSRITNGKTNSQDAVADGEYPLFDRSVAIKRSNKYLFNDTAVILPGEGAEFIPRYYSGKFDLHQRVYAIFPAESVFPSFLFQYLCANRAVFAQNAVGSTVKSLRLPIIEAVDVLLPPVAEQKKIAEILTSVDEEIQKTEEIIAATEKIKKGLVSRLFTNHINSKRYKIREICEVTSSKRVMVADYVEGGVPFYRSTEIIKKSKNLPVTNPLYISADKFNFFKSRFGAPEAGDILITAVGTIGDVYLVQNETFYFKDGNTVWIRKIKDSVLPKYLSMILSSSFYRDKLNNVAGGSSQKALTIEKLESVDVPIPSTSEQEKLVKILSSIDSKIFINKRIKEQYALLKRGLMQDLLTGKKRTI